MARATATLPMTTHLLRPSVLGAHYVADWNFSISTLLSPRQLSPVQRDWKLPHGFGLQYIKQSLGKKQGNHQISSVGGNLSVRFAHIHIIGARECLKAVLPRAARQLVPIKHKGTPGSPLSNASQRAVTERDLSRSNKGWHKYLFVILFPTVFIPPCNLHYNWILIVHFSKQRAIWYRL